jgi:hypothetical protein
MFTGYNPLQRIAHFLHPLIEALRDAPDEEMALTDAEIPLSTGQQAEASSLSVALFQMGLIKRLPETPPPNPDGR